jgi:hypothetical protein
MGEVVSLESHRRARAARLLPPSAEGAVERLSDAVERLETALSEADGASEQAEIRRELVALHEAVRAGRYSLAADRTERLIERLRRHG